MQKLLPYLVAISAFSAMPAIAADDSISDQVKLQMAYEQHVIVTPAEVDARIARLRADKVMMAPPAGADLRTHIIAQIAWEKTAH